VATLRALIRRHWPVVAAALVVVMLLALPEYRFGGTTDRPAVEAYQGRVVGVRGVDPVAEPTPLPTGPVDQDPFPGLSFDPFDPGASFPPIGGPIDEPADSGFDPLAPPEGDIRVLMLEGPDAGTEIWAYLGMAATSARAEDFRPGDEVVVTFTRQPDGPAFVAVSDRWRMPVLGLLLLLFVVAVLIVGRGHGLRALIALALTAAVVLKIVVPLILEGAPPVPVAVIVASVITIVTVTLTEGWNRAAAAAILGTVSALLVTGVLSAVVSELAGFSASGTEDLVFLEIAAGQPLDVRGLLLAAFILGALGVLDDVTVTQATTVDELSLQRGLAGRHLWSSSLRIGRAHIAATVNTLFLAYVGASLPLLVLFAVIQQPSTLTLNSELVAVEIVRTLVGSLGIVLAVPLTTAIATFMVTRAARSGDGRE
jgi:uncharacterized membrane protein